MEVQRIQVVVPTPHEGQVKVLKEAKRFNVLCCGRRWGKSKLATRLLCKTALTAPVGYFTPTYKLLEGTFKEAANILAPVIKRKHENQFIELTSGHTFDFWSMDNPYAGRSKKYKLVVLDEAAFSKQLWESWTESIRPTLTDLKGDAWFMSTPKGKNDFYKLFMRGKAGEENWVSWQMPTVSNPYIDPNEIEDAKKDLPALAFAQEYLAEFNENIANPFGVEFIKMCTYPISSRPPVAFGIDLAKSFDWTVIIGLDSLGQVCYFDRFQLPWRETIQKIKLLPYASMKIDSTGVGDPIVEELKQTMPHAEGFKFNQTSKQQLMEGLQVAIQQRLISFPEGQITDELNNFEYIYTRTGVRYSAPEGLHDDCVCALALALDAKKSGGTGAYSWV